WQQVYQAPAPVSAHRPDVPADLERLVSRLLAKNPADRPGSAREVNASLVQISGGPVAGGGPAAVPVGAGAAAAGGAPARARAAVGATRTRTMPVLDVPPDTSPDRGGFRLGVGGVAAVAVAAAAVTALIVAIALATSPDPVTAPAGDGTSATTSPSTSAAPPPEATIDGLR